MKNQAGFTLIELIVVIVILGILAATAIPRYGDLNERANKAVAHGILGAIQTSAVVQFGVNNGFAVTFSSIESNTQVDADPALNIRVNVNGAGLKPFGGGSNTCAATGDSTIIVDVNGQVASGVLIDALCTN